MRNFRIWDFSINKMIYLCDGIILRFYEDGWDYGYPDAGGDIHTTHEGNTATLQQSTGLKDKNGVEIYEGDVVNIFRQSYRVSFGQWCGEDFYDTCSYGYYVQRISDDVQSQLLGSDIWVPEIIGNIYENPELLGE